MNDNILITINDGWIRKRSAPINLLSTKFLKSHKYIYTKCRPPFQEFNHFTRVLISLIKEPSHLHNEVSLQRVININNPTKYPFFDLLDQFKISKLIFTIELKWWSYFWHFLEEALAYFVDEVADVAGFSCLWNLPNIMRITS